MVLVPSQAKQPENGGHMVGKKGKIPVFGELFGALKGLPKPMRILLLVTCLNWIAWFPFLLFDTKEVCGGKVGKEKLYDHGVGAGALRLMLSVGVLGCTSLAMEFLACGLGGVKRLWGIANFLLAVCLAMTIRITKLAEFTRRHTTYTDDAKPSVTGVKVDALALFTILGIPQADRPVGIVSFQTAKDSNDTLNSWAMNLEKLLDLVEKSCHQIHKEAMVHKTALQVRKISLGDPLSVHLDHNHELEC